MNTFTIGDNTLDVSDLTDRVDELRDERALGPGDGDSWAEAHPEEAAELAQLEALLSELAGGGGDHQWEGDWYPSALIHEDHFETAMDEMLEDIGALPDNLPSYLSITVDYDALRTDYSEVNIDGHSYLYR